MKTFLTFLMVITILTFLVVGLSLLLLGQGPSWYYLAIASLANGFIIGLVLKKI